MLNYTDKVVQISGEKFSSEHIKSNESVQEDRKNTKSNTLLESIVPEKVEESYEERTMREYTEDQEVEEVLTERVKAQPIPIVPQEPNFLEKFFAENALAKIGGILLFLGVLFFLSLIFTAL